MAPTTGGAAAGCNGPEDCAWSPHKGCMCGTYGSFQGVKIGWQAESLTVLFTEYEFGTICATVYSGDPFSEADHGYLDSLASVTAEAVDVWTHKGPATGRIHFHGTLRP